MLTVRCPKCSHDQLCDPKINQNTPTIVGKKKRCVYCGTTFPIHADMLKSRVVQVGKREEMNYPLF